MRCCGAQVGLNYVCHTAERFFAVQKCLVTLVESLQQAPSVRLLKHIIRCFLRRTDTARAREALRSHSPLLLLDPDFTACLKDDGQTRQCAPSCYHPSCYHPCAGNQHDFWICCVMGLRQWQLTAAKLMRSYCLNLRQNCCCKG